MRSTKQKQLLQQQIASFTSFFNAENVHEKIRHKSSKMGIATVYRFLKSMEGRGELHSFLCNRKTIYSTNKNNHCHFTCEKCGKVKHLPAKNLDFLPVGIEGEVCHIQIDVTGICKECVSKIN